MKHAWILLALAAPGLVALVSCQRSAAPVVANTAPPPDPEELIKSYLAKLGAEDRRLAEQQRYCPVMPEIRLGQMGMPYKVVLKGVPLIVCCKNCVEQAQENPEVALAKARELMEGRIDAMNEAAPAKYGK
jgi:hypothetical protein